MLNFPGSPSVGQQYPVIPVAGVPVYTWDGEKWTSGGVPVSSSSAAGLEYSGYQINGCHEVSQALAAGVVYCQNAIAWVTDQWRLSAAGATLQVAGQIDTSAVLTPGHNACAKITQTIAQASLVTANHAMFYQTLEGYRIARWRWGATGAIPITVAFWIRSAYTGYIAVSMNRVGGICGYVTDVQIFAANTWEYKTVTFPPPTIGTAWANDNCTFTFCFGAGPTYQATPNTWVNNGGSGVYATATTTNIGALAVGVNVYLTGLLILPGAYAPTADNSFIANKSIEDVWSDAQRYYLRIQAILSSGYIGAGGAIHDTIFFPVVMRIAPAASFLSGSGDNAAAINYGFVNQFTAQYYMTAGAAAAGYWSGILQFDARI